MKKHISAQAGARVFYRREEMHEAEAVKCCSLYMVFHQSIWLFLSSGVSGILRIDNDKNILLRDR